MFFYSVRVLEPNGNVVKQETVTKTIFQERLTYAINV